MYNTDVYITMHGHIKIRHRNMYTAHTDAHKIHIQLI